MTADRTQPETEQRRALRVHGRVQGVGFRWWALRQARSLGLRGRVRNRPDGTVEVAMAGPPAAVEEMVRRLAVGPPAARVQRLEELPAPAELPDDFEIGL